MGIEPLSSAAREALGSVVVFRSKPEDAGFLRRARDLLARGLYARDARWALNTDAICARKLLDAMDRQRKTSDQG